MEYYNKEDSELDLELMMEFRQMHDELWIEFLEEKGYTKNDDD